MGALLIIALAGCSDVGTKPPPTAASSNPPQTTPPAPASPPAVTTVGDGTSAQQSGYTLTSVSLPSKAGSPGEVRFQIASDDGAPVMDYLPHQTKDLHLYLVRTDLAVFRHLHPTLDDEGFWSAPVTLPKPGDYRVITEFVAGDGEDGRDPVLLGKVATVPGDWSPEDVQSASVDQSATIGVDIQSDLHVGPSGRLHLVVHDTQGRPVQLGAYLGTFGHVTGFHVASGSVVHLHPLGQPQPTDAGTHLAFHTEFEKPGAYVLFVQVRVDGFLHTVRLPANVT